MGKGVHSWGSTWPRPQDSSSRCHHLSRAHHRGSDQNESSLKDGVIRCEEGDKKKMRNGGQRSNGVGGKWTSREKGVGAANLWELLSLIVEEEGVGRADALDLQGVRTVVTQGLLEKRERLVMITRRSEEKEGDLMVEQVAARSIHIICNHNSRRGYAKRAVRVLVEHLNELNLWGVRRGGRGSDSTVLEPGAAQRSRT